MLNLTALPVSDGGFFKAADHADAHAILVEVKKFEAQRPSQYGPQDVITADVTIFDTAADLDAGEPSKVMRGAGVTGKGLTNDLSAIVGQATVASLELRESKKPGYRPFYVWSAVSAATIKKVAAYGEKREAEKAAAIESAPDFD